MFILGLGLWRVAAAQGMSTVNRGLLTRLLAAPTSRARHALLVSAGARIDAAFVDQVLNLAEDGHQSRRETLKLTEIALNAAQLLNAPPQVASALYDRGAAQAALGDTVSAGASYAQALAVYEKLGDHDGQANCLRGEGDLASTQGQNVQACALYAKAVAQFTAARDQQGVADSYVSLAVTQNAAGEHTQAFASYGRARDAYRTIGSRQGEADCYKGEGDVCCAENDHRQATARYLKALAIYRSLGRRESEAYTIQSLGDVSFQTGDYVGAMNDYHRARLIYESLKKTASAASCAEGEADMAVQMGDFAQGNDLYGQAFALYRGVGDTAGESACYKGMGEIAFFTHNHVRAQQMYSNAIDLDHARGDVNGEATCWQSKGDVALQALEPHDAMTYYANGERLFRKVANVGGEADCLKGEGDVYLYLSEFGNALDRYGMALPMYQQVGNRLGEAWDFHSRSICFENLGRLKDALQALDGARACVETSREWGGTPGLRSVVMEQFLVIYHDAARIALALGQYHKAFRLAEAGRYRSLNELMTNGGIHVYRYLDAAEHARGDALESALAQANARLSATLAVHPQDAARLQAGEQARQAALKALDVFEKQLYQKRPMLAAARGLRTVDAAMTSDLVPEGALFIEYVVCASQTLIFTVAPRGLCAVETAKIASADLAKRVQAYRDACMHRGAEWKHSPLEAARKRAELGQQLYDLLVKPALRGRPGQLILCPDGPLCELPFDALMNGSRYLVADYALSYTPSANLLRAAIERARLQSKAPLPPATAVVFANPEYGHRTWTLAPGHEQFALTPQPDTQDQASVLKQVFPTAAVYTGIAAQEARADHDLDRYRYIVFATHGMMDDQIPLYSALALAQPSAGSNTDGLLEARELAHMKLRASLIAMTSCTGGHGPGRAGNGQLGMAWAATVAGIPSALLTSWDPSVSCATPSVAGQLSPAACLLRDFFTQLSAGRPKAQALRAVQLSMMKNPQYADPACWAPFFLTGDWQ